jgi:hypothetical protein
MRPMRSSFVALAALSCLAACSSSVRRFPLREPLAKDTDLHAVNVPCRLEPTKKDPKHVACAPEVYVSPLAWDAANNTLFRPLARVFAVDPAGEAVNVNALDEAPDSAWFTNRIGARPYPIEELDRGACSVDAVLDPGLAKPGSWVVDQGKNNGATPGFRVKIGKAKYLFKADSIEQPERPSAASVIGSAIYHAVGFNTSCEQVVYFDRKLLKLQPGLKVTDNSGITRDFDQAALDKVLDNATHRGELIRMQASAWLPGRLIGPFRYDGVRDDDPNDVIPHEDRRDLRGGRLVAAWLDHFDAREQNSMDSWISDNKEDPDASPGFVRHYYLDTSDSLGSEWAWDGISRRLGHSYLLDFEDVGVDFITLGILPRAWDQVQRRPGGELFGYFETKLFKPEKWLNEYPNPTFSRMSERDGAWMARILARFTPEMVRRLAEMGKFNDPNHTAILTEILQGRLDAILRYYLSAYSPITDLKVEGDALCGVDLAKRRAIRPGADFHFAAALRTEVDASDARTKPLAVTTRGDAEVCVALPHVAADGGSADDAPGRYVVVKLTDGVAREPLEAHLYDLGPARGYRLAGIAG